MPPKDQKRTYLTTHPWITFRFETHRLDYRTWLLLGEAQSKWEHIKGAPLLPETIKRMHAVYLAKGALATTAIEGNTLTEDEVEKRINGNLKLPPSREYLGLEIDNVVAAYNQIASSLLKAHESEKLSVDVIQGYNRLVLKDLPLEEGVVPGEVRNYSVTIAGYRGAPPEDCEYLLRKYVDWLNNDFILQDDNKIVVGLIKAILAHLYFVWIHPFGDGNGRTARLIEFQIMLSIGAPSVAAHLLSNHYNATRTEYYRHLAQTSKTDEAVADFVYYALRGFVDGLREEIESIQKQQVIVHWENHIHKKFRGLNSKTENRQKDFMLEISKQKPEGFDFSEIRHTTPKIAEMYATMSDMTIKRDLSELVKSGLLIQENNKFKCNYSVLNVYRSLGRD